MSTHQDLGVYDRLQRPEDYGYSPTADDLSPPPAWFVQEYGPGSDAYLAAWGQQPEQETQ